MRCCPVPPHWSLSHAPLVASPCRAVCTVPGCQNGVFLLKELESTGNKAGVVANTVKDVVMLMESDGLVKMEKVGAQNIFWSWPSDAARAAENKAAKAQALIERSEGRLEAAAAAMVGASEGKEASAERTARLQRLEALKAANAALKAEVATLAANDPEVIAGLDKKAGMAKAAAERWTDNVWQIKKYVIDKMGMGSSEFDKSVGLPADFDYPE